ncbi:MAG TPA: pyroglutamyl-peptidase I [Blastocatellia bacterium]|nr:pyroglutamyl-peptidase I [Blastocatellia bacterium]
MNRILLSGFEPFDGEPSNPSLEVSRALSGSDFDGAVVKAIELPVDRYRAVQIASEAITSIKPELFIMFGEAGGRFRVTPERIAINVDDYRIPDNAGNQPCGEPIVEGGAAAYFSTLPIKEIVSSLIERDIPAAISSSAGTYLCNRVFYSTMHLISVERMNTRAGFIHLPYMHRQAISKRHDFPSLALETLIEAGRIAIRVAREKS